VAPGAGVDGTVDGAVDGVLLVGTVIAGGGRGATAGIGGNCSPLSAPGGVVLGVGVLETSGEAGFL
jgi:hypothetical protein